MLTETGPVRHAVVLHHQSVHAAIVGIAVIILDTEKDFD